MILSIRLLIYCLTNIQLNRTPTWQHIKKSASPYGPRWHTHHRSPAHDVSTIIWVHISLANFPDSLSYGSSYKNIMTPSGIVQCSQEGPTPIWESVRHRTILTSSLINLAYIFIPPLIWTTWTGVQTFHCAPTASLPHPHLYIECDTSSSSPPTIIYINQWMIYNMSEPHILYSFLTMFHSTARRTAYIPWVNRE